MEPHDDFTIGRRIRAARILAGYKKPGDLAGEITRRGYKRGLGRTTLYGLEQDKGDPADARDLDVIAEVCGLPLAWFSADFSRLEEISEDPRKVLARERAAALARAEERRAGTNGANQPRRAEDQ